MTALDQIRAARESLSSSSTAKDPTMCVLCTAAARVVANRLRAELDQLERDVTAIEVEIGRASRDVTQLPLLEREGPQ